MNDKEKATYEYFDHMILASKQKVDLLQSDNRNDEAALEKIYGNVFDIFKTVFQVALRNDNDEAKLEFFCSRLEQIPKNWYLALNKANEFNDSDRAYKEQIKINALANIKENMGKIWGVTL